MAPPVAVEDVALPPPDPVHGSQVGRHLPALEEPPRPQQGVGHRAVQTGRCTGRALSASAAHLGPSNGDRPTPTRPGLCTRWLVFFASVQARWLIPDRGE